MQWDITGNKDKPTFTPRSYRNKDVPVELIGETSEADVLIQGFKSKALLDTGSQVTTLAKWFHDKYLAEYPIQTIFSLFNIETASGHDMGYLGVCELDLEFPDLEGNPSIVTPVLIVDSTNFNKDVPLLVGTNILKHCLHHLKENVGSNFLQKIKVSSLKLALQSSAVKQKHSLENNGKVICSKAVVLPPHSKVPVSGLTRVNIPKSLVLTETADFPMLPSGIAVIPTVQKAEFTTTSAKRIHVELENLTDHEIILPSKSVLCCLQQVNIVPQSTLPTTLSDEEFLKQFTLGINLTQEQQEKVRDLLIKWKHLFSTGENDIGKTDLVKHKIELSNQEPFKEAYRRIPPHLYTEVRNHLQDMINADVIRPSNSPFASPIVLVRKSDQTLRFCVDYRKLNSRTIHDAFPLPRVQETLDSLVGAKYFSSLDLKSGYWQVEVEECDKHKTAFTAGPLGFFEFNRMGFGLVNAPACFQRLMQMAMGDLHLKECLLYLDDIIVFSSTFEQHLERLESVFHRLQQANLKLKPSKCFLFKDQVKYLGHIVSQNGISTDPEKIETLKSWPVPRNVQDLRRFLGFAGYYRRFIKGYSNLAKPLNMLLRGHESKQKGKKGKKPPNVGNTKFLWGPSEQSAFETLISHLCESPVLGFADFSKPFIVHTDASLDGLGAILYQNQDGKNRPISFASRGLTTAESKYPAHKLEFLALKWAVTEKFCDYLMGARFTVKTDNNPLTYIMSSAKLDALGQRWVSALSDFNFTLEYRSGKSNIDADALSRLPKAIREQQQHGTDSKSVTSDIVSAICEAMVVQDIAAIDTICLSEQHVFDAITEPTTISQMNSDELLHEQLRDPHIATIIQHLKHKTPIISRQLRNLNLRRLHRQLDHYVIKNKVLVRKVMVGDKIQFQIVLPPQLRKQALEGLHDKIGHMGRERTLNLVKERYFWPRMAGDVANYINMCKRCKHHKAGSRQVAPLVNIKSTQPLELVCIDHLSLEPSKGGIENILVMTDHYTRYAQAVPCKSQNARTTAKILIDTFVNHYGIPQRLLSDQGPAFESKVIAELCKLLGINKCRTTPYHAMSNGQCERLNRTLLSMLGTLENHQKADWKSHVGTLVHAYNCTKHESTGYTPFFLMFGRSPRLPVDVIISMDNEEDEQEYNTYVSSLKERLSKAYRVAQSEITKNQSQQKKRYDEKARAVVLEKGDRVLVRNVKIRGKHKLADTWENTPYTVLQQPNKEIPVYRIQEEGDMGCIRTVHRNLLLPISNLPLETDEQQTAVSDTGEQNNEEAALGIQTTSAQKDSGEEGSDNDDDDPENNRLSCMDENQNKDEHPNKQLTTEKDRCETNKQTTAETQTSPTIRRSQRTRRSPVRYRDDDWIMY